MFKWASLFFFVGFAGVLLVGTGYSPEFSQARASMEGDHIPRPKGKPLATAMDAARAVCFIASKRGMDCEVDVLNARISIPLEVSEREAKRACLDMVSAISGNTKLFNDRGWTFRIMHPKKKTKKPLAVCGII